MDLAFPEIEEPPVKRTEVAAVAAAALDLSKIDLNDVALAQFGKWRDEVAHATKTLTDVVHDLSTPTKLAEAKSLRARVVGAPRAEARKVAEELKSKLAKVSKSIGAERDTIVAAWDEVEKLITPQIEARDAEVAAEKAAKERAAAEAAAKEAARKQAHTDAIDTIAGYIGKAAGKDSATLTAGIAYVEGLDVSAAVFEEFAEQAATTKAGTLETLRAMLRKAVEDEQAAQRAMEQRIENERIAAENKAAADRLAAEKAEFERQRAEFAAQQEAARKAAEPTLPAGAPVVMTAVFDGETRVIRSALPPDELEERFGDRLDGPTDAMVQIHASGVTVTEVTPETIVAEFTAVPAFPQVATPEGDRGPGPVTLIEPKTDTQAEARMASAIAFAERFSFERESEDHWVFSTDGIADLIDAVRAA